MIHILHDTPAGAPLFTPGTGLDEEYPTIAPRAGESVVHKNQPISFTGGYSLEFSSAVTCRMCEGD